ncbi:MAG: PQQ-binding-like beta-propeller repeat protein [Actinoplanes sp.]
MALIELDLTAQPDLTPRSLPPAHRYRLPGLLLALVLALVLGGAAPGQAVLWRYLGLVPSSGGPEAPFQLAGGRIWTMATDGADRLATAWSIDEPPRPLWTARFPTRVVGPDQVGFGSVDAQPAGDVVLLSDGPAITAVDARTGRTRWTSPVVVTPLAGHQVGVQQVQQFRPGTVYDQSSGDPGMIYFSSTGEPHTEPPTRSEVRGLDLRTGRSLWSVSAPGSVNMFVAPGDDPAVLVLSSGRLERRDGGAGTLQRQIAMPRLGGSGPSSGELIDGLLLVHWSDLGHEIAYDPVTLAQLWERDLPEVLLDPANCVDVLCAGGQSALDVLDPATGAARWRAGRNVDLMASSGYVLEVDSRSSDPVRLADPATGRSRVDLSGWRLDVSGPEGVPLVVIRTEVKPLTSAFAVVDTRHDVLQPLGAVTGAVSSCLADGQHVVCRGDDGLRVWAYRS